MRVIVVMIDGEPHEFVALNDMMQQSQFAPQYTQNQPPQYQPPQYQYTQMPSYPVLEHQPERRHFYISPVFLGLTAAFVIWYLASHN